VKIPLWSRLRLAPRIIVVLLLSMMATKMVDNAARYLIKPPDIMFFDQTWLIGTLRDIRQVSSAAPAAEREAALLTLPARHWFDIAVLPSRPDLGGRQPTGAFEQLRLEIADALDLPQQDVLLKGEDLEDPEYSLRPLVAILPTLPLLMKGVMEDEDSNMLAGELRIAFRIAPETWLLVTPKSDGQETARMIRNVLLPIMALLLVAGMTVWLARGIVRPLETLAAAAEKLGRDREPTLVDGLNAPELQAIGTSFNAMQLRLKRFVDDRLQMIAAISHDLRTPLTRLRLFAEYLPDPDQRRQVLSDIADMEAMMSATLTFASNQLKDEPQSSVDLASLLISLCDTAADAGSNISYDGPDHAKLQCRPVAIRRAFANLIDNGCKFGDRVQVTLRDSAATIVVTVADDGPGIPAEQREAAMRPFTRLETSRNRETGGTGLGLTIAQDVILAHRGRIELGDAAAGGLQVTVTLPRAV
jgi:signal transduction histidine kinase